MRRCMSDGVGTDGRVIPSRGLDFIFACLDDFELVSKTIGQLTLLWKGG
jgi:hypothetical protein